MNTTTTKQIITKSLRRSCLHFSLPLLPPKKVISPIFCLCLQQLLNHKPLPTNHINKLSDIHCCKYLNPGFLFKRYYTTDPLQNTEFNGVSGDTELFGLYEQQNNNKQFHEEVRHLCEKGKVNEAVALFQTTPSIFAAEIILRSFSEKENCLENAFEVYGTLVQYFTPTPNIFFLLLLHCNEHDPRKCTEVISEMEIYDIQMREHMFRILCSAAFKSKNLFIARKLLKTVSRGCNFIPSSQDCQYLLNAFSSHGSHIDAIQLMHLMDENNIEITLDCFFFLILACLKTPEGIESGKKVHQRLTETPFLLNEKVFKLLFLMYSTSGSFDSIDTLFVGKEDFISDPYFWRMIFKFHAEVDHHLGLISLFWDRVVVRKSFTPDLKILTLVLKSCREVGPASQYVGVKISSMIQVDKHIKDFQLIYALLNMYTKCGFHLEAYNLYFKFREKYRNFPIRIHEEFLEACLNLRKSGSLQFNTELTSALNQIYKIARSNSAFGPHLITKLLKLYASFGDRSMTKQIFDQSPSIFHPISSTSFYHTILRACGDLGPVALSFCKQIDQEIIEQKLIAIDRSLLSVLVQMYFRCGDEQSALKRFEQYSELKEYPPQLSFLYALRACSKIGPPALEMGKKIHHRMKKKSQDLVDCEAMITIINMYTNCGNSELGLTFYFVISKIKDYQKRERIALAALNACVSPQYLEQGKKIHEQWSNKREVTPKILAGLITMYARCGCFEVSKELFHNNATKKGDPLLWKAIFHACFISNNAEFAIECFHEMKTIGIELNDDDVFLDLMRVCNSCGLFETSLNYFEEMQRLGLIPSKDHTDLLQIAQNSIKTSTPPPI